VISSPLHLLSTPVPRPPPSLPSFPTRRSSDLRSTDRHPPLSHWSISDQSPACSPRGKRRAPAGPYSKYGTQCHLGLLAAFASLRSEEHTSELQSLRHLVCRLLLEKKKQYHTTP